MQQVAFLETDQNLFEQLRVLKIWFKEGEDSSWNESNNLLVTSKSLLLKARYQY